MLLPKLPRNILTRVLRKSFYATECKTNKEDAGKGKKPPAKAAAATKKEGKMKKFKIYRYNPHTPHTKPHLQEYVIDMNQCGPMVLDALFKIKNELDTTLAFRRSCREGVCGSCAMNINGLNELACITRFEAKGVCVVHPLPHMYVIKDVITDFRRFIEQYNAIMPYVIRKSENEVGRRQFLQSMKDRLYLDGMYECVLCACCSHSCPAYWWNGRKFLGPAALMHALRWIKDTRDEAAEERLNMLKAEYPLFKCHTIMQCTNACPKHLNPGKAISELKRLVAGVSHLKKPDMIGYDSQCAKKVNP